MAKIGSTDLALVTARVKCCRLGAARLGFTPYDVKGPGQTYPCEYMWREVKPPTTQWTLQTEGVVCGKRPVAAFTMTGVSDPPDPPTPTSTVTGTVTYDDPGGPTIWVGINVEMTVDGVPWPAGDAITDLFGVYTFTGVPAGDVAVTVWGVPPPGARSGANNGTTVPPATLTLDMYCVGI